MTKLLPDRPNRGPAEHAVRDQIIKTASECFGHYGYMKTTVADLARELGFSKTYIYRFFESKQAIGEEICAAHLAALLDQARTHLAEGASAADRFRRFFHSITEQTTKLLYEDKRIYEIAVIACMEDWTPALAYIDSLHAIIVDIVQYGRDRGEFEKKTPIDEIARSILFAMGPFIDPAHLHRNVKRLPAAQNEMIGLILRSLAV